MDLFAIRAVNAIVESLEGAALEWALAAAPFASSAIASSIGRDGPSNTRGTNRLPCTASLRAPATSS
jgi:hypothetical protein